MKKYAAVDLNSGFVWGVASAVTPEAACAAIASEADSHREFLDFESISNYEVRETSGGFAVYAVDENYEVQDGAAAGEIAKTKAFPLVGYFRECR